MEKRNLVNGVKYLGRKLLGETYREIALSEGVTTQAIKATIAHPEIHRIKEYFGEILIKLSYSEIEEILNEKGKMNQRSSALIHQKPFSEFEGYQASSLISFWNEGSSTPRSPF